MNKKPARAAQKGHDFYFGIARAVSMGATCPRASVGVILVKDRRVLTTGYNGAPSKHPECQDVGCKIVDGHCQRVIHAEMNAVSQAAQSGVSVGGSTAYVYFHNHNEGSNYLPLTGEFKMSDFPCYPCWQALMGAGVKQVYWLYDTGEVAHYGPPNVY